jgi:hypothetical protein
VYQEVQVHRYECLRCKRTFRVYPEGTTAAQTGCAGSFLRDVAYYYRFCVFYAKYHPLLCLAEAECLGHPFCKEQLESDLLVPFCLRERSGTI